MRIFAFHDLASTDSPWGRSFHIKEGWRRYENAFEAFGRLEDLVCPSVLSYSGFSLTKAGQFASGGSESVQRPLMDHLLPVRTSFSTPSTLFQLVKF